MYKEDNVACQLVPQELIPVNHLHRLTNIICAGWVREIENFLTCIATSGRLLVINKPAHAIGAISYHG